MAVRDETTILVAGGASGALPALEEAITGHLPGCAVRTADCADRALSTANRTPLDIVLIDVRTSQADGLDICRRLKADQTTSNIPILLMTARDASAEQKSTELDAGADDVIRMPFEDAELIARISFILRLKKSEDRYRRLFEQSNDAIFVHAPDGKILDVNSRACEMLGYTRDRLLTMSVPSLHPESELDRAHKAMKDIGDRESIRFESVFIGANGALIDVEISARIVDPETGAVQGVARDMTERKQLEKRLREERDFAEGMIDTAQAIVLVLDTNARIVRFNQYMEDISGYRLDEVRGKDWFSTFLPQKDHDHIRELFLNAIGDIQTHGNVNAILTKSGQERLIEWYDKTLKDETGRIVGILAVGQDITERKRAEQALRESEERFRALAMSAPEGIFQADPQGGGIYINRKICQITGLAPKVHHGDGWIQAVHPADRKHTKEAWLRTVRGESDFRGEFRFVSTEGDITWVSSSAARLTDSSEQTTGFIGTLTDITELKQTEEALRQNEQKYRTLFENMAQGVFYQRKDGTLIDVNEAALGMFGLSRDEFLERGYHEPLWKMIREDGSEYPFQRHPSIAALKTGEAVKNAVAGIYNPQKEDYVWLNINATPQFRPGEKEPHQVFVTLHNITDRKHAEAEAAEEARINQMLLDSLPCIAMLVRPQTLEIVAVNKAAAKAGAVPGETCWSSWMRRESPCPWCLTPKTQATGKEQRLEAEFMDTTWDIHWSPVSDDLYLHYAFDVTEQKDMELQLRQAQKMEAIGRLAGGIAHDFRNELTIISGYAEWLLAHVDADSDHARYADHILDAARRSSRLTGHMLAFSRRETLAPTVVSPMAIIDKLRDPLKHVIGDKVRLLVSGSDDLDNITIDTTQFEQMLVNLATNAGEAMPDGGELRIDVAPAEFDSRHTRRNIDAQPGKYVAISVSDTGVGMDAETRRNSFDPFFTTKPVGTGTGLSLSMVYGFVRQSGGYITVDSEVGHGSTFTIYLPSTVEGPKRIASNDDSPATTDQATRVILTVEDDENLRDMLVWILRQDGHTVISAGNASQALPLGEHYEGRIDLLITDVVMPGNSGVELARSLKEIRPDMAVLFISGYGDSELVRQGIVDCNAELLIKPFSPDELLDTANRILA
ncbi:MAG: PAS domain S-box protein [Phycisphaerae bacterium]|jgi:PAS domain S-box-containing protein|nr:PAS domain S-box protein [Phycisphaerae bacterium]